MSDKKLNPASKYILGAGLIHKIDLIVASVIIIGGAFMYYEATLFPAAPNILGDTLNADVFPKMLIVLMIILASIIPFEISFMPEKIAKIDKGRSDKLRANYLENYCLTYSFSFGCRVFRPCSDYVCYCRIFPACLGRKKLSKNSNLFGCIPNICLLSIQQGAWSIL